MSIPQAAMVRVPSSQRGVSLIELMVAITIGMLVTLGLIQIFGASRASSMTQEGLSRVQENGRFLTQQLQRQMRMVGFEGCAADSERVKDHSMINHMADFATGNVPSPQYRFQRPLEGFTVGASSVPAELADDQDDMVADSDGLVLRTLSEQSIPVFTTRRDGANLYVTIPPDIVYPDVVAAGDAIYVLQNCVRSDVFEGIAGGGTLTANGLGGLNQYTGGAEGPWPALVTGQSLFDSLVDAGTITGVAEVPKELDNEVHRGEYMAFYLKNNAAGTPSFYMRRFGRTAGGTTLAAAEELVEGVEGLQIRYGVDTSATPDGTVDTFQTAEEVVAGAAGEPAVDDRWRRVLSVRIAVLLRSEERAAVSNTDVDGAARTFNLLGEEVTSPADGRMRQVYETTIAIRNRIFSS